MNVDGAIYSHTNLKYKGSTGELTSAKFKTPTGKNTEFLKADGSVDSNTYLTSYINTWNANSRTADGYVLKGLGKAGMV